MDPLHQRQHTNLTPPLRSDIPYASAYAPHQHPGMLIERGAVLLELPPVGQAGWLRLTRDEAMGLGCLLIASAHAADVRMGED